ncbi:hypothetical protein KKH03_04290 [Patescibacteria group bacterium]|nr:hypothetical protein [Patescibacteria group bacterium]
MANATRPPCGAKKARAAKAALITTLLLVVAALAGCGDDFSSCSYEQDENGNSMRVCRDEDGDVLSSTDVAKGTCVVSTATQLDDGTIVVACENGESIKLPPGAAGAQGAPGVGCEVFETSTGICEMVCEHTTAQFACNTGSTGTGGTGGSTGGTVTNYQLCSFNGPPASNDPNAYLAVSDAYADGATSGLWGCQTLKMSTTANTTVASVVFAAGKCAETVKVVGAVVGAVSWDTGHATFSGAAGAPTYADFGSASGCAVAFGGGAATVSVIPLGTN